MLLTFDEIIDIADSMLEYSDFGNYYGDDDTMIKFAVELIKREREKEDGLATE